MEKNKKSKITRRDFFKLTGAGVMASAAALYGWSHKKENTDSETAALGEIPTDKMVYRTNPTTGDRISLLGYGCMRWPTRKKADGSGDEIDQEAVNELIDYAIAHGVNYFDTSPAYVQGLSERATGIALKRHPRDKFFLGKNRNPQFLCLFRLRRIRFPVVADEVRCLPRDAAGHGAALLFDVGFERAAVFEEVHIARDDEGQTFAGSVGLLLGGDVLQCELCHQAVEEVFVFIVSKPVQERV